MFNEMLKRIARREADGIIAWHPDRLRSNADDGGQVIHFLDTGKLFDLRFPIFTFENSPQGKFMLMIMFGHSKYEVDTLSEHVERGNITARSGNSAGCPACRRWGTSIFVPIPARGSLAATRSGFRS